MSDLISGSDFMRLYGGQSGMDSINQAASLQNLYPQSYDELSQQAAQQPVSQQHPSGKAPFSVFTGSDLPWELVDTHAYQKWLNRRQALVYKALSDPTLGPYGVDARKAWDSLDSNTRSNLLWSDTSDQITKDKPYGDLGNIAQELVGPGLHKTVLDYLNEHGGAGGIEAEASGLPSEFGGAGLASTLVQHDPGTQLRNIVAKIPGLGRLIQKDPTQEKAKATTELAKLFGDWKEPLGDKVFSAPVRALDHFARAVQEIHRNNNQPVKESLTDAWRKTTKGTDSMGDVVATAVGADHVGPWFHKAASFTFNLAGDTLVDPIQLALTLGGGEFLGLGEKAATKAAEYSPEAMERILASKATEDALKATVGKSEGFISRLAEHHNWYMGESTVKELSRANTLEEGQDVLRHGWQTSDLKTLPHLAPKIISIPALDEGAASWIGNLGRILPRRQFDLYAPNWDKDVRRVLEAAGKDKLGRWATGLSNEWADGWVSKMFDARGARDGQTAMEHMVSAQREAWMTRSGVDEDKLNAILQDVAGAKNGSWANSYLPEELRQGSQKIPQRVFAVKPTEDGVEAISHRVATSQADYTVSIANPKQQAEMFRVLEDPTQWSKFAGGASSVDEVMRNMMGKWSAFKLAAPAWSLKVGSDEAIQMIRKLGLKDFARRWWDQFGYEAKSLINPAKALEENPELANRVYPQDVMARHSSLGGRLPLPDGARAAYRALFAEAEERFGKDAASKFNEWMMSKPEDSMHMTNWYRVLNYQIPGDPVWRIMASTELSGNAIKDAGEGVRASYDYLKEGSDPARTWLQSNGYKDAAANPKLLDEGPFGKVRASVEKSLRKHWDIVKYQVPDSLRATAANGVHWEDLRSIPVAERPVTWGLGIDPELKGGIGASTYQKYLPYVDQPSVKILGKFLDKLTWFNDIIRKSGFNGLVDKEIERTTKIFEGMGHDVTDPNVQMQIEKHAVDMASRDTPKLIHNPEERTVFDNAVKGYMPFTFAKVQFVKRWARAWAENPRMVRELQIMTGAMRDSGWIEKDANNNYVVNIPVMPEVASWVLDKFFHVPGLGGFFSKMIVGHDDEADNSWQGVLKRQFAGTAGFMVPKFLPFGADMVPTLGPTITFPLAAIAAAKPSWKQVMNTVLGSGQSSYDPNNGFVNNILDQVGRSWMHDTSRGLKGVYTGDDGDRLYANSVTDVLRWMAIHDHDPNKPANQHAAHNIAGTLYILRGMMKFFAPYTIPSTMPGSEIANEYLKNEGSYGPEKALDMLLTKHGDSAVVFAGPKSKSNKVRYPDTAQGMAFYSSHQDLYGRFPDVAGFFAADASVGKPFDYNVYQGKLADHTSAPLSPADSITASNVKGGNNAYFGNVIPVYDKALANGYSPEDLKDWLAAQKKRIDGQFPGWLHYNSAWSQRAFDRSTSIDQLRSAMSDPSVKGSKTAQALQQWYGYYDKALAAAHQAGYQGLAGKGLVDLRRWLSGAAQGILDDTKDEGFKTAYDYLFRGQLEDSADTSNEAAA